MNDEAISVRVFDYSHPADRGGKDVDHKGHQLCLQGIHKGSQD